MRRDGDAVERVRVHHALRVVARRVDGAVDDEAGRVDRKRRLLQHLAVDVDLDQARRRDLVEHQPVRVDQEVLGARDLRGDVGEDEVVPAEQRDQAIGGGEVERAPAIPRRETRPSSCGVRRERSPGAFMAASSEKGGRERKYPRARRGT